MKEFKFSGIPSGDYECFVFAVDRETFIRITGKKPTKFDKNKFLKSKYNLYPSVFFPDEVEINVNILITNRLSGAVESTG